MNNPSCLCITTFNKKLYNKYAFGFMDTFPKLKNFDLVVYSEDDMEFMKEKHKFDFEIRKSFECIPELKEFIDRNYERNEKDKKRSFQYDAIRFSYKVFCVTHCGLNLKKKYDYLMWLDSDILFKKDFNLDDRFVKENCLMSFLGRQNCYSECGLLIFNLNHPNINDYLLECKKMYTTNNIYKLKVWHDCECFDEIRRRFTKNQNINFFNISNNIRSGDVFGNTFLKTYMYHFKGQRKDFIKKMKY